MYVFYNPNPVGKKTTDCVIRMLTKVFDLTWVEAYLALSEVVLHEYEMPSSNYIWETFLTQNGFTMSLLPRRLSVKEFASHYSKGIFVACTGSHVVAIEDGLYFDAWDSGDEIVSYYFWK